MKRLLLFLLFFVSITLSAEVTIIMEKDGGVYKIPCLVNGAKMKFIFDTGAATVCLSESMAEYLLDNDYISKEDIVGVGTSIVADGSEVEHLKIILKDIEIGGLHLNDVEASIIEGQRAPLLLGQSAIQKLGKISIENNHLIIEQGYNDDCYIEESVYTFKQIKIKAEEGYSDGHYEQLLAKCYHNGECVPKDFEKAAYWYKKSAEKDNLEGMIGWADCLYQGHGVEQDYSRAIYWYQKAADLDDAYALYCLGYAYGNGIGVNLDIYKGFKYTRLAAEKNNQFAKEELPSYFDYFLQEAKRGVVTAMFYVSLCYSEGYGISKNLKSAFNWCKNGAEQGDVSCQNNLALMYRDGEGTNQDIVSAIYWFKKSAEAGNVKAQYNIAQLYYDGKGVPVDYNQAYYWFYRASELGYTDAICKLGDIFYHGYGVIQDYSKAMEYYKRAAEQGSDYAIFSIGEMYWSGIGVEKNYQVAVDWWYQCSSDYAPKNYKIAIAWLEGKGREKDIRNYCGWILRCWDNENKSMEGMKMLAYDLALGRNGWGKNMDQAFLVINDAIDMDPEDPENYDTKGYFFSIQGKYAEAKEMWLKVKSIDPSYYKENNTELHKYILKHNK